MTKVIVPPTPERITHGNIVINRGHFRNVSALAMHDILYNKGIINDDQLATCRRFYLSCVAHDNPVDIKASNYERERVDATKFDDVSHVEHISLADDFRNIIKLLTINEFRAVRFVVMEDISLRILPRVMGVRYHKARDYFFDGLDGVEKYLTGKR